MIQVQEIDAIPHTLPKEPMDGVLVNYGLFVLRSRKRVDISCAVVSHMPHDFVAQKMMGGMQEYVLSL
jgi:hypothetical protein